ncbi:hypothetical protein D3C81_2274740 [compost metagenome]
MYQVGALSQGVRLIIRASHGLGKPRTLWERVYPRTPAEPVPYTASPSSRVNPLPQGPQSGPPGAYQRP